MQKLKKVYRSNYAGESIISELTLAGGEWDPTVEYVPSAVTNIHTTTQAVAIGNGTSRQKFDLGLITRHKGGIFGNNRLQSYGCNALYRDFTPNFLIATGDEIVKEIASSGYTNENIVYTNGGAILKYPGKFYLVPQNPYYDAGSLAAYMACFDGHKKVFLIGFDQDEAGPSLTNNIYVGSNGYPAADVVQNSEFLVRSLSHVATTYPEIEFVRVMPEKTWHLHEYFLPLPNFRQIDYNQFAIEADLG